MVVHTRAHTAGRRLGDGPHHRMPEAQRTVRLPEPGESDAGDLGLRTYPMKVAGAKLSLLTSLDASCQASTVREVVPAQVVEVGLRPGPEPMTPAPGAVAERGQMTTLPFFTQGRQYSSSPKPMDPNETNTPVPRDGLREDGNDGTASSSRSEVSAAAGVRPIASAASTSSGAGARLRLRLLLAGVGGPVTRGVTWVAV